MKLTKIVCTLGPASSSEEGIRGLLQRGMNIARINFSHGTQDGHRETIQRVKTVSESTGIPVALMLDTKGCEIRTGDVSEPITITEGEECYFSFKEIPDADKKVIRVNYAAFADDVKDAESILIDNGTLSFELVNVRDGIVTARSLDSGIITSRRHVNLPGANVSLPSMTEQDWSDLEYVGIAENMDFIALSFIRTATEVTEVRQFLDKHDSPMRIITKIETRQAVANIEAIIDASDGIMVARGDLGAEMPFEKIPAVQDQIVDLCRKKGKPVIVATHMLESMIENPMPTRAEVTDIAHAATTRADCTMLSGETAAGKHPFEAIEAMSRILQETESHLTDESATTNLTCLTDNRAALASAAVSMATRISAPMIVVLTRSGRTAQAVSRLRPVVPIIACTPDAKAERSLQIHYGVTTTLIPFNGDPEEIVLRCLSTLKDRSVLRGGETVVVIADAPSGSTGIHTVQVRTVH